MKKVTKNIETFEIKKITSLCIKMKNFANIAISMQM